MKRLVHIIPCLAVLIVGYFLLFESQETTQYSPNNSDSQQPVAEQLPAAYEQQPSADYSGPSGNHFLVEHGSANSDGMQDLRYVGRVVDKLMLLFKNLDTRHVANIEQLSAFLVGDNPEGLQYLDPGLPIFKDGLLTDRWGQPYIIHPIGTGQLELRSSGPDQTPYTEDDFILHPEYGKR